MAICAIAVRGQQAKPPDNSKELAVLEGRVLGADQAPLRKATLRLQALDLKPGENNQFYSAISDADGAFIFDGIEPGRYNLSGHHAGFLESSYGSKKSSAPGTVLTLSSGQRMKDLTFSLTPQATISGRVLDSDGDPVPFAQINLLRSMYVNGKRQLVPSGVSQADAMGEFKCASVAAGRYYLSADVPGDSWMTTRRTHAQATSDKPDEQLIKTFYPGFFDPSAASLLEVSAGADMRGIDIHMSKSAVFRIRGKLTGTISSDSGHRFQVFASPHGESYFFRMGGSAQIAKDGTFELNGIAPGSYDLIGAGTQGMLKVLARRTIDVSNHNLDDVVLVAQPSGKLRGTVRLESSPSQSPVDLTTVRINLSVPGGISFSAPNAGTKDDGTFTLDDISPAKYRLNVWGVPDGAYLKAAKLGDRDALADDLDLTGGIAGGLIEVILSAAAGEIDGAVQDDQQQPATGAMVTLIPDPADARNNYLSKTAATDQNGQFSLKSLAPGKYRLYAWEDLEPGNQSDPEFMKPLEGLGLKVTVAENGKQALILTRITTAQIEKAQGK